MRDSAVSDRKQKGARKARGAGAGGAAAAERIAATLRAVAEVAGPCALFAIVFGVLFGEYFGDLGRRWLGLQPIWFDREEAIVPFLVLTLSIGVVHVVLGLALGVLAGARRHPRRALGRGLSAGMILLIVLALLAALEVLPRQVLTPVVVALLVIALIALYNRFVRLRNRVDNAWAQIEVQLKRRHDLIPNLVETVKGYAAHERQVFENVTAARSAATAAHWVNDLGKGAKESQRAPLRVMSLSDNVSWLTALANDEGYERVFAGQLENFARPRDVLVVLSASGNSPNLLRAVEMAHARKMITVGFLGFDGGALKNLVDEVLLLPTRKGAYGLVESGHDLFCHILTACLAADRAETEKFPARASA